MTDKSNWKLVPVEPTKAMVDAAYAAHDAYDDKPEPKAWCGLADAYRAMLDAAPASPSPTSAGWPDPLAERMLREAVEAAKVAEVCAILAARYTDKGNAEGANWKPQVSYRVASAYEAHLKRIADALAALTPAPTPVEAITARYTNWRGETAERTFIPHRVFFGSNEWHPEPQVLIEATDCEKGAMRTFAAAGFALAKPAPAVEAVREALEKVRAAYERARYQPGDCPVIPHKLDTLMKELEAALAPAGPPFDRQPVGYIRAEDAAGIGERDEASIWGKPFAGSVAVYTAPAAQAGTVTQEGER